MHTYSLLIFVPSAIAFVPLLTRVVPGGVGYASTTTNRFSAYLDTLSPTSSSSSSSFPLSSSSSSQFTTIFDFTNSTLKNQSLSSFERIDDAIMGGISTSRLADAPGCDHVRWSGVCRTEGGGFCGTRTKSLEQPLSAMNQDGIFIVCRLVSDDEPQRRVWKVSLRTNASRGEMMLYQAAFTLPTPPPSSQEVPWTTVQIPWDAFRMVRGPIAIPSAPPLNISQGIYQIGLIMSKFQIGPSMQEMPNFRPGYFDVQIAKMGFYKNTSQYTSPVVSSVVPSAKEVEKKSPILSMVFRFIFSEQANRRKSAMTILTRDKGWTRFQVLLWAMKWKRKSGGLGTALSSTCKIISMDILRTVLALVLRITIVYPFRVGRILQKRIQGILPK